MSQIGDIADLGDRIRRKIDRRALRDIFDEEITRASLEHGMERIEEEVLRPMERFIQMVRGYRS